MPQWSGDGSFLYFYRVRPRPLSAKCLPDGGESVEMAPWEYNTHFRAQIDPAGRTTVCELHEPARPSRTLMRDLATGWETPLGSPLQGPRWSRDGREIVGWTEDNRVAVCPAAGGDCTVVASGIRPRWSGDGSRIYFLRPGQTRGWFDLWSVVRDGSDEKTNHSARTFPPDGGPLRRLPQRSDHLGADPRG